ncbi:hypothetical protein [Haloarchaeobius sp. HRN-SO-5]|uniref:hypothetical protein n=1 Tax=Haloarchaeobius sp. HRN-SO-5 TaxID=3446118 RepID=UPI003EBD41F1
MTFRHPALEIDADFGSGTTTGMFEFPGGLSDGGGFEVELQGRTGPLVNNQLSQVYSFLTEVTGVGESGRKGVTVDFGGGEFAVQISGDLWDGEMSTRSGTAQWGSSTDPGTLNQSTATGASAEQKMQVFMEYWRYASIGSLTPARLTLGEYHPNGVLESPLGVVIEQPQVAINSQRAGVADIQLSLVETVTLDGALDALNQTGQ